MIKNFLVRIALDSQLQTQRTTPDDIIHALSSNLGAPLNFQLEASSVPLARKELQPHKVINTHKYDELGNRKKPKIIMTFKNKKIIENQHYNNTEACAPHILYIYIIYISFE